MCTRRVTARALVSQKDRRAREALLELLDDGDEVVRAVAAEAFEHHCGAEPVSELAALLQSVKPALRRVAASALARRGRPALRAILCLGVIWRGETSHADQIGGAVTRALMEIGIETGVPCIHEVLTVANRAQARRRCIDPETNRGIEAAHAALEISEALGGIRSRSPKHHTA